MRYREFEGCSIARMAGRGSSEPERGAKGVGGGRWLGRAPSGGGSLGGVGQALDAVTRQSVMKASIAALESEERGRGEEASERQRRSRRFHSQNMMARFRMAALALALITAGFGVLSLIGLVVRHRVPTNGTLAAGLAVSTGLSLVALVLSWLGWYKPVWKRRWYPWIAAAMLLCLYVAAYLSL
jgi:hypothetical protein